VSTTPDTMTTLDPKRKALGRGLDSLLPRIQAPPVAAPETTRLEPSLDPSAETVREIPLELLDPNPYQTRTQMDEAALEELAASIRASGVLQPIVVRYIDGGRYQLIAGQRRWAASQRAGRLTIPALVRQVSNEQAMQMTIIENLQREDLNPIEQARAFERLANEFGLTQEQIAERTGKNRASIANFLRLLRLPEYVQWLISSGELSAGHGKALMMLPSEDLVLKMAERIRKQALSVHQTEQEVHEWIAPSGPAQPVAQQSQQDPNVRDVERLLAQLMGVRVRIKARTDTSGAIIFNYASLEQFDGIVERLRR
jgi:ParB family transcriptional regulator, chromosome partitioning protein